MSLVFIIKYVFDVYSIKVFVFSDYIFCRYFSFDREKINI